MNAKEVLTEAARLLRDVGWTQSVLARDANGAPTYIGDEGATCFCMIGALGLAGSNTGEYQAAVDRLSHLVGRGKIADFNDTWGRTKEECIAKLLEAAEL